MPDSPASTPEHLPPVRRRAAGLPPEPDPPASDSTASVPLDRRSAVRHGGPPPAARDGAGRSTTLPRILPTVWRGVRRRCPHCGRGPLFVRWITLHRQCADCGLVYLRNQGDIWFFWIVMDRIPILLGIAAIFFGFRITTWWNGLAFFLAIAGPLVATMPQRQGAAVALSYLSRVYFRDPSDALPVPVDDRAHQ